MNPSLAADRHHFKIFSVNVRRAVARAVVARPELLKVLAQRGLSGGIERCQRTNRRTAIGTEEPNSAGGKGYRTRYMCFVVFTLAVPSRSRSRTVASSPHFTGDTISGGGGTYLPMILNIWPM